MRINISASLGWLLILPLSHGGAATLQVLGDRVNLRAAPIPEAEVVAQVSRTDTLVAAGETSGDWVKVVAPERVNFWVRRDLLRDGAATTSKVHVRVGPGINYRVASALAAGERVTIRGESGEWVQIAPPAGVALWIHRRYVQDAGSAVPPAAPKPEPPTPEPAQPETPVPALLKPRPATVEPPVEQEYRLAVAPPPAMPPFLSPAPPSRSSGTQDERGGATPPMPPTEPPVSGGAGPAVGQPPIATDVAGLPPKLVSRLVSLRKQGEPSRYYGRLRPTGLMWRRPSRYRLVAPDATGRLQAVCYLVGDRESLGRVLGHEVCAIGREYWLTRLQQPVVVVADLEDCGPR